MTTRFEQPVAGPPASVAFPPVHRDVLSNGLRVWSVAHGALPVVSLALVLDAGTAADPPDRPGLSSLVGALTTEGAGSRDAIAMAEALARIGGRLDVQPGADRLTLSLSTLARHLPAALDLLADVARRPRFAAEDFARVRDLRLSRLRQASRVASTVADRALIAAVFGDHPYGHGALGTSRSVEAVLPDEVRGFWATTWTPAGGTLIVSGGIDADSVPALAATAFGDWAPASIARRPATVAPAVSPSPAVIVVHRPGAAQAELRVGHAGPARGTPRYHALVTLNALLGGQFTSRINQQLRERLAVTYGARSAFDMRRAGGLFSVDTSIQSDAAVVGAREILRELRDVSAPGAMTTAELDHARAGLTRGYVRHFETAGQIARALVDLVTYDLPDDAFDRFVPAVGDLSVEDVSQAAREALHPDQASVVVVTDLDVHGAALDALGLPVVQAAPEF